ncbi:MAG: serine hydrolase [Alphaproteobacteria bacterium]|nr:serine hydrolase [Alphaproteobacteria bacterium]
MLNRIALFCLLLAPLPALASGLPQGDPAALGFAPDRLARIDAAMQRYVDEGKLAGMTIAIARDGKVAYEKSVGMADTAKGRPMTPDTLIRIYSMSKPVTAVAAMILVEEGRLHLTDKLGDILPEFKDTQVFESEGPDGVRTVPPKQPIRIFNLLTHTSGLSYPGDFDPTPVGRIYDKKDVFNAANTLAEMSRKTATIPLTDQPGHYHYGASIDILGRVIEVITGKPLDVFLKERIFEPLGMHDTMFVVPARLQDRFAELYTTGKDGTLAPLREGAGLGLYREDAKLVSGGGGLVSTVGDYMRFCQMMLNGGELGGVRILSPETVRLMTTGQIPADRRGNLPEHRPGSNMGLGFGVLEDLGASEMPGSVGTFGWAGAASTQFFIDPREKIVAVLMTQYMPSDTYSLRADLKDLTYQALVEPRDADAPGGSR